MTPNAFLYETLSKVCKGTYVAYKPGKAPPLPWFVYTRRNGEEFFADDSNYARIPRYRVELLFEENDPVLVSRFEEALTEVGTWKLYSADYLDSEGCLIHDYRLSMSLGKLRESEAGNG